ncbi:MAG: phosphopantothenoylcysteine decarboxylase domain-containing protein [Phycisphaerales bacterium]
MPSPSSQPAQSHTRANAAHPRLRFLLTAGPTHEPIDQVRFIGNRSSGRLGIALAEHLAGVGHEVKLLLGPTPLLPNDSRVEVARFRTTADLQGLLSENFPNTDVLIMAAAVADYRPRPAPPEADGKVRRQKEGMTLHLDPTPDLLSECAGRRLPGQILVGFALEPRSRMLESARAKLHRKGVDLIVANPLETMDSGAIEAVIVSRFGTEAATPGPISKEAFPAFLLAQIALARAGS